MFDMFGNDLSQTDSFGTSRLNIPDADVSKARIYYRNRRTGVIAVDTFDPCDQTLTQMILNTNTVSQMVYRAAGDASPIYPHDFV